MANITHMAYVRVAAEAVPAPAVLRPVDAGVNDFLSDHIRDLRNLAATRKTQPGRFIDAETQALFRSLCYGTEADFLMAADSLTKRLIGEMDGRTAAGLLVCLRATDEPDHVAGVLKLQVVAEHAAVLERLETGDEVLAAVTRLLDKPGDLQKGALVASFLSDERVLVGDRLFQDAVYFPRAFGIQVFSRPSEAVGELLDAVDVVAPEATEQASAELQAVPAGSLENVLAALSERVPALTPAAQADVTQRLRYRAKPVDYVDTGRQGTERLTIGRITISGPVPEMRRCATVQQLGDGKWQVTVDGDEEPRRTYR